MAGWRRVGTANGESKRVAAQQTRTSECCFLLWTKASQEGEREGRASLLNGIHRRFQKSPPFQKNGEMTDRLGPQHHTGGARMDRLTTPAEAYSKRPSWMAPGDGGPSAQAIPGACCGSNGHVRDVADDHRKPQSDSKRTSAQATPVSSPAQTPSRCLSQPAGGPGQPS